MFFTSATSLLFLFLVFIKQGQLPNLLPRPLPRPYYTLDQVLVIPEHP